MNIYLLFSITSLWNRRDCAIRLNTLADWEYEQTKLSATDNQQLNLVYPLSRLQDRLGQCGYFDSSERKRLKIILWAIPSLICLVAKLIIFCFKGFGPSLIALGVSTYLSLIFVLYFLKCRQINFKREVTFYSPIFLEQIILLVESGLGLLPAIQQTIDSQESKLQKPNPVSRIFGLVYQLSAHGLEFSYALELVANAIQLRLLKHILLHLDIAANEGGELIPSLRALATYAHEEWRLEVESRVRRLENLAVFPVFGAVIGLMLLTAAVPLVPLLDLHQSLNTKPAQLSNGQSIRFGTNP